MSYGLFLPCADESVFGVTFVLLVVAKTVSFCNSWNVTVAGGTSLSQSIRLFCWIWFVGTVRMLISFDLA